MKKLLVAVFFLFSFPVNAGIVGMVFKVGRGFFGSGAAGLTVFPLTYFFGGKYVDTLPDAKKIEWHLPTFYGSDVEQSVNILRKVFRDFGINPSSVEMKLTERLTSSVKPLRLGDTGLKWKGEKYVLINPEYLKREGKSAFELKARQAAVRLQGVEQSAYLLAVPAAVAPFFLKGAMKSTGFFKRALARNTISVAIVLLLDIPVSYYFEKRAEEALAA